MTTIDPDLLTHTMTQIEALGEMIALHEVMLTSIWDQVEAAADEIGLSDAEIIAIVYPSTVRDLEAAINEQDPGYLDEYPDLALGAAAHMMLRWARSRKEHQ